MAMLSFVTDIGQSDLTEIINSEQMDVDLMRTIEYAMKLPDDAFTADKRAGNTIELREFVRFDQVKLSEAMTEKNVGPEKLSHALLGRSRKWLYHKLLRGQMALGDLYAVERALELEHGTLILKEDNDA